MNPTVRIATVNILNDRSRWLEKRSMLAEGLAAQSLDLIALQEVTAPLGTGTAQWLAHALGNYAVWVCPKSGWGKTWEGMATLSRLPVIRHATLDLRSQQRTAQLVEVLIGGLPLVLVNGHFFWPPGVRGARMPQVRRLLSWIEEVASGKPVVVCGDFNATPGSPPFSGCRGGDYRLGDRLDRHLRDREGQGSHERLLGRLTAKKWAGGDDPAESRSRTGRRRASRL